MGSCKVKRMWLLNTHALQRVPLPLAPSIEASRLPGNPHTNLSQDGATFLGESHSPKGLPLAQPGLHCTL
jgi:hypothetical protein